MGIKVTIRKRPDGTLTAYIAKKDLEEVILPAEDKGLWGTSVTLANGWCLELPAMAAETPLPVTVEARRLPDAS